VVGGEWSVVRGPWSCGPVVRGHNSAFAIPHSALKSYLRTLVSYSSQFRIPLPLPWSVVRSTVFCDHLRTLVHSYFRTLVRLCLSCSFRIRERTFVLSYASAFGVHSAFRTPHCDDSTFPPGRVPPRLPARRGFQPGGMPLRGRAWAGGRIRHSAFRPGLNRCLPFVLAARPPVVVGLCESPEETMAGVRA
jgi:hypothetical protein